MGMHSSQVCKISNKKFRKISWLEWNSKDFILCVVFSCMSQQAILRADGEDGALKVWSRTGMLRTSLAQSGTSLPPLPNALF